MQREEGFITSSLFREVHHARKWIQQPQCCPPKPTGKTANSVRNKEQELAKRTRTAATPTTAQRSNASVREQTRRCRPQPRKTCGANERCANIGRVKKTSPPYHSDMAGLSRSRCPATGEGFRRRCDRPPARRHLPPVYQSRPLRLPLAPR